MPAPEVVIVPVVFAIPAAVITVRMWFKHTERMATLKGVSNPMLEARLTRIEEAVETIAIEIERMGEGQRFVTKLLAEGAGKLPESSMPAPSVRVKTPH